MLTPASSETVAVALPAAAIGLVPIHYLSFKQATDGWAFGTDGLALLEGRAES